MRSKSGMDGSTRTVSWDFALFVLTVSFVISSSNCQIPDAVCPGTGAVNVQQPELAVREAGATAILTCQFRVPPGQLAQVTWIGTEGNLVIFRYSPADGITNDDTQLVLDYATNYDDTAGTGSCNITLLAEVSNTDIYRCEVFLKNHTYCTDQKGIDFVEPARTMSCNGTVICSSSEETCEGAKYDGCCTFGGFIDFCRPESVLSLWYINGNGNENWIEINTSEEIGLNQNGYCEATLTSLECMGCSENRRIMFHVTEGLTTYMMWITIPYCDPDPPWTSLSTMTDPPSTSLSTMTDPPSTSLNSTTGASALWLGLFLTFLVISIILIVIILYGCRKNLMHYGHQRDGGAYDDCTVRSNGRTEPDINPYLSDHGYERVAPVYENSSPLNESSGSISFVGS